MDLREQIRRIIHKEHEVVTQNLIMYGRMRKIYDRMLGDLENVPDHELLIFRSRMVELIAAENERYLDRIRSTSGPQNDTPDH